MTAVAAGISDDPDAQVLLCVRMKQREIRALDQIAKHRAQNRSELVRDLLLAGIRIFDAAPQPQEVTAHDETSNHAQSV